MWEQLNGAGRFNLILGSTYLSGAFALLIVMLTADLGPEVFSSSFVLLYQFGLLMTKRWKERRVRAARATYP